MTSVRVKASDVLGRDEIARLTELSNLRGAVAVLGTWGVIAATLWLLARFPHPAMFVLAVVVLGGRQLALAILMHEAAHRTLFQSRWLNDWVGDWLCARPTWGHLARYRKHHIGHHAHTGDERDPDRSLTAPFPVSRAALARKLLRDLSGIAGVRRAIGLVMMDLELIEYTVAGGAVPKPDGRRSAAFRHLAGVVLTNLALFAVLAASGHGWLYGVWALSWFTTYGLFLRIRSIAEHACTEDTANPFRNTRTTRAGLLARLTVAPHRVNFHLEHHLLVAVPWFRLPELHRILGERGALDGAMLAPSYVSVLRAATAR
jgi:fatty acid desaturase